VSVAPQLQYTVDDLERLSVRDRRYELIAGELREMSPAGGRQGSATIHLSSFATVHVIQNGLGACFAADTGFTLQRGPDTVLAPDWSFVAAGRVPNPLPKSFGELVPDLVLETRSPNDSKREIRNKVDLWLRSTGCASSGISTRRSRY
jgi:Uma2 family endonuclease